MSILNFGDIYISKGRLIFEYCRTLCVVEIVFSFLFIFFYFEVISHLEKSCQGKALQRI